MKSPIKKIKSVVLNQIMCILPDKTCAAIYRNKVTVPFELQDGFTFKMASSIEELEDCFKILHDAYVEIGVIQPDPSGMRMTPYHLLPTSIVLVIKFEEEVIGTVTLVRDSKLGLPSQSFWPIEQIRRSNMNVAEISALAIKPKWRGEVFLPLLKYVCNLGEYYLGLDGYVFTSHGSWFKFYESVFFFQRLEQKYISTFGNINLKNKMSITGEYLDFKTFREKLAQYFAHKHENRNLFKYFYSHNLKEAILPSQEFYSIINPLINAVTLKHFLDKMPNILDTLSQDQVFILKKILHDLELSQVFSEQDQDITEFDSNRKESRLPVCLNALLFKDNKQICSCRLLDISESGCHVVLPSNIKIIDDEYLKIKVELGMFNIAKIKVNKVWNKNNLEYGFKIMRNSPLWHKYIKLIKPKSEIDSR